MDTLPHTLWVDWSSSKTIGDRLSPLWITWGFTPQVSCVARCIEWFMYHKLYTMRNKSISRRNAYTFFSANRDKPLWNYYCYFIASVTSREIGSFYVKIPIHFVRAVLSPPFFFPLYCTSMTACHARNQEPIVLWQVALLCAHSTRVYNTHHLCWSL